MGKSNKKSVHNFGKTLPKQSEKPLSPADRVQLEAGGLVGTYERLKRSRQRLVMGVFQAADLPAPRAVADAVLDEDHPLHYVNKDGQYMACDLGTAITVYWRPYVALVNALAQLLETVGQAGRKWELTRNYWFEVLIPAISKLSTIGYYPDLLHHAVGAVGATEGEQAAAASKELAALADGDKAMPGLNDVEKYVFVKKTKTWRWRRYFEARWIRDSMAQYVDDFGVGWDPKTGNVVQRDADGRPILSGWSQRVCDDVTALLSSYTDGGEAYAVFHTHDRTHAADDESQVILAPPHVHVLLHFKQTTSLYTLLCRSGRGEIMNSWLEQATYLQKLRGQSKEVVGPQDFFARVKKLVDSIQGTCNNYTLIQHWDATMAYITHYRVSKGKARPRPLAEIDLGENGEPLKTTYSVHDVFCWNADRSYSAQTGIYDDVSYKLGHADLLELIHSPLGVAHELPKHVKRTRTERHCWYTLAMLEEFRTAWERDGDIGVLDLYAQWLAAGTVQPGDWADLLVGSLPPADYTRVMTAYNGGNGLVNRLKRIDQLHEQALNRRTDSHRLTTHYISSSVGGAGKSLLANLMGQAAHGWRPGYVPEANTTKATGLTHDKWGEYNGQRFAVDDEAGAYETTYEGVKIEHDPWAGGQKIASSRNHSKNLGNLETIYMTQTDDPLKYLFDVLTKTKGSLSRGYMDTISLGITDAWQYYIHWSQLARRLPSAISLLVDGGKTTIIVSRLSCRPALIKQPDVTDTAWLDDHCYYVHPVNGVKTFPWVLGDVPADQREDRALEMALWVNKTIKAVAEQWTAYWQAHPDLRWIPADDPDWTRTIMATTCTGRPYTPQPAGGDDSDPTGNDPDPDEWSDYHSAPVRAMKHEIETIAHRLRGIAKQSLPDDTWLGGLPTANILDAPGLHYDPALTAGLRVNSADVIGMSVYHGLATIRDGGGTAVMIGTTPALCCELDPVNTAMSPYNRLYLWHGGVDSDGNDRVMWLACQYVTIPAGLSTPMTTAICGVVEDNWGSSDSYVDGGRPRVYMVDPRRR